MLNVSPTDIPTPAADSFDAAICCSDRANGSNAAGAAAGWAGFAGAAGFGAGAAAGFRLANDGRTLPVTGLADVGNLPKGCVPEPLTAAEDEVEALLSAAFGSDLVVDVEAGGFVVPAEGETRRFFLLSASARYDPISMLSRDIDAKEK